MTIGKISFLEDQGRAYNMKPGLQMPERLLLRNRRNVEHFGVVFLLAVGEW